MDDQKGRAMTSNRVIALCVIALLAFQGYAVLAFIFMEKWGIGALAVALVVYLALLGGWLWALLVAARGSRRGLITVAVFSLFPVAAAASDLLVFCPSPCQDHWPLSEISFWSTLLAGLLAVLAVSVYLRGEKKAA